MKKHQKLVNQTLNHMNDEMIVFVGDSITEQWAVNGQTVWSKYYSSRGTYNYGIGGDQTQQVLYRIQNKEFDGLHPKVIVLLIGTNNVYLNETLDDIAHGVNETVRELLAKMPKSKLILLGVLPRGEPLGTKCKQLNELIKNLDNQQTVYYLDMWSQFEDPSGHIRTELYTSGLLHLTQLGYHVWQQTMEPLLNKLDPTIF
ncbi:platelet-activating factor acetylhydrolase IB subunit alpha1-like [Oppia nitens]|uniref:platelet-activating factor acetylhydrolase IB subunit alpha1-like n=1 Tax=Oppia nitens TaxID=1686743 RepID=UPI0023DCAF84|nr:platelet-activating factor acetylhydrolase IB subunit alpha1-like [Oppia nitens]